MIKYLMAENSEERYVWRYYPEGREPYGEAFYNKKTKEYGVLKHSYKNEWDEYYLHMFSEIRRFIESGEFKEKGMVAWY